MPSNADIDRLGERYRRDPSNVSVLSELFEFCNDVRAKTSGVLPILRTHTGLPITPRNGKSFVSILEKLHRQAVKLSAMQDIEGCRIIVDSLIEQDALLLRLRGAFEESTTYDRRRQPRSGYRAIHLVIRANGARYEVQIRTRLQHSWAEVSERLAERFGSEIKYGKAPSSPEAAHAAAALSDTSGGIEKCEEVEALIWKLWIGHIDEPADEMADEIDILLNDLSPGPFDEASMSTWAEKAQRGLLEYKKAWADGLSRARDTGQLE